MRAFARSGGFSSDIPAQGYTAELTSSGDVYLWRVDNWTLLGQGSISFSLGTWYTLGLRANGSSISVEVNGNTVIGPVTNTAFTSGNTGVWSYAPNGAGRHRFDNFSVTMLGGGFTGASKVLALRVYTKVERRILAAVTPPSTGLTYRVYYYAGGRPIAMRVLPPNDGVGTVHYLLSDHLGSMSASVDPNLNVTRQYFYPYGGVRSGSGTLPTAKGFTGQYSDATGLMYFNARYYSQTLGRFVSADTIVPGAGEPQALNRFSYVLGNPLRLIDPSGHTQICSQRCEEEYDNRWANLARYGVKLKGSWTMADAMVIKDEIKAIANKLVSACNSCASLVPAFEVFNKVFGRTTIELLNDGKGLGCAASAVGFSCSEGTRGKLSAPTQKGLVTHELGHTFDHNIDGWGYGRTRLDRASIIDAFGNHVTGRNAQNTFERTSAGYQCSDFPCMQHPIDLDDLGPTAGEDFADMFMSWVQNSFSNDSAGRARNHWMTTNMGEWLETSMSR